MAWQDDIPGIRDIRKGSAGSYLPRRNVLQVHGAIATDDPEQRETVLEVYVEPVTQPASLASAGTIPNANSDFYRITSTFDVEGLGAPADGEKVFVHLINVSGFAINVVHDGADNAADGFSFASGGDYSIPNGSFLFALYDRSISRWRGW